MLKLPAFISNKVERNGDNCILTLTTKQAKLVAIIGSVVLVLALVLGIWGIVRQAEVVQLRQQTQLQSEQLKLLQQKTEVLDKKIQNLNQISEENKKMLKGAESGTPAQDCPKWIRKHKNCLLASIRCAIFFVMVAHKI